jgi:ATP-dependent exoDNAse (exonuclease V) alpha subunit
MLQSQALQILQMGFNVFLTGQAGSGKTYTLNQFITWAKEHRIGIAVTASTGIAATHIGGTTIHAWSGIGIKDNITKQDLQKLAKRKELQKRFNTTKILIIDEISMLSADFFDNLNLICQHFKENNLPFGGLQIILCGDLFQLPPISRGINPAKMVVHSSAWSQLKPIICYLKEQHRQNQTDDLSLILGRIRAGEISQQEVKILTTKISTQKEPGITQLFSHNADVDYINQIELDKLGTEQKTFFTQTEGKRALVETLLKSCLAPQELKLKLGAEVMFVKNDQSGRYANGTRGKVVNFKKETGFPVVETPEGRIIVTEPDSWSIQDETGQDIAAITQIPLRLAWAITIHKSQGMTLDSAFINLQKVFEYGMGYVALSRIKTLSGLYLEGFNQMSLQINPKLIKINAQLTKHSDLAADRLTKLNLSEVDKNIEQSIKNKGGVLKAEPIQKQAIQKKVGGKGQKDSHKTSANLLLEGKSFTEVATQREVKEQTVINHLARHIQESPDPKKELLKFKNFKPPAEQIKAVKKVLKENEQLQQDSRYALKELQQKVLESGLKLSYEQLSLTLIWL